MGSRRIDTSGVKGEVAWRLADNPLVYFMAGLRGKTCHGLCHRRGDQKPQDGEEEAKTMPRPLSETVVRPRRKMRRDGQETFERPRLS